MSKMSKIDQIHLRAVMLCMSKMSKTPKDLHCNSYTYIFNVFDNNQINSRKSVRNLLWLVLISSTSSTYIALQPLGEFDLSSTSSTLL